VLCGAGLLGVGAHFANTVGDTEADAATGVRGLPQRIGARASLVTTAVAVCLAALVLGAVVLAAGASHRGAAAVALLGVGAVLSAGGAVGAGTTRGGRGPFRLTLLAVALVVAGFVTGA